jgi:hypothetical protein
MHYVYITLADRRTPPYPVCLTAEGYRALAGGRPADVPVYRVREALTQALTARPDLTEVTITAGGLDVLEGRTVLRRSLSALPTWTGRRCRCGAVAVLQEDVFWQDGTRERVTQVDWCSRCYAVAYGAETSPAPPSPPTQATSTLDAETIIGDWEAAKLFGLDLAEGREGGEPCAPTR